MTQPCLDTPAWTKLAPAPLHDVKTQFLSAKIKSISDAESKSQNEEMRASPQLFPDVHPFFPSIVGMEGWCSFVALSPSYSYKTPGGKVRLANDYEETSQFLLITS